MVLLREAVEARGRLVELRKHVANLAQCMGVQTFRLPLTGKDGRAIASMANNQEEGWEELIEQILLKAV